MSKQLPPGSNITLYPLAATWGTLRWFVKMADEADVPDDANLRCLFDINGEFDGIAFGPEDGVAEG